MHRNARDLSWGRLFHYSQEILAPVWRDEIKSLIDNADHKVLAHGLGRTYGDSCLNKGGSLVDMGRLDRILSFDEKEGIIECEAGVSLEKILHFIVPKGWFLPVTPGTKFVTVGGAIANDVHGKNHHVAGTFGQHVEEFELIRSDRGALSCSLQENSDLFRASIGGIGLTGIISKAKIRLKKISSAEISVKTIPFANIQEFFAINDGNEADYEYTVAWLDCQARGRNLGRGLLYCGNHQSSKDALSAYKPQPKSKLAVPIEAPNLLLNQFTIKAFNVLYYTMKKSRARGQSSTHYDPFFYPLDGINKWNLLYGKRGFYQYQCILPLHQREALIDLLRMIAQSNQGSFLAVLKKFGDKPSPGLLSFPMPGYTLALDFANAGERTHKLFLGLNHLVHTHGGRIYAAKDAQVDGSAFRLSYPNWEKFHLQLDPKITSSFWLRVKQ